MPPVSARILMFIPRRNEICRSGSNLNAEIDNWKKSGWANIFASLSRINSPQTNLEKTSHSKQSL